VTDTSNLTFNPPPGWPRPPAGWQPPAGWSPDPKWPAAPDGWQLWLPSSAPSTASPPTDAAQPDPTPARTVAPTTTDPSARIVYLESEVEALRSQLQAAAGEDYVDLSDDRVLQDIGIYRYHHPLENAAQYVDRLNDLQSKIAEVVKAGRAIVKSNLFTFDNSLAKGRKMADDLGKLMLRAYNSEADNSIRSLKVGNAVTAKRRLQATRDAIAKLGSMMEMRISDEFHDLRVEEIELTSDFLMKRQEERQAERDERAMLREQRKVELELAAERERLDKEHSHLSNALEALRASGTTDPDLEARLLEVQEAIAQNDYRAANIRAGYVYVISNRGAFGDDMVKIGLTRRLEPIERVRELSGASVPFRFDVHTIFFSEDAVTLETELHKHFATRAVNQANPRKEFFFATPSEVREVLLEKVGNLLEFKEHADATEFLQSVGLWPKTENTRRTVVTPNEPVVGAVSQEE
jgi:hypothetical protein